MVCYTIIYYNMYNITPKLATMKHLKKNWVFFKKCPPRRERERARAAERRDLAAARAAADPAPTPLPEPPHTVAGGRAVGRRGPEAAATPWGEQRAAEARAAAEAAARRRSRAPPHLTCMRSEGR